MLGLGSLLCGAAVERPHTSLSPRSEPERTEQLLSDQTIPPSSPPSASGARTMNEQWCPSACPLKPESLVASSANDTDGGVITARNASGIITSPPKCNLCDSPFLFVVSIGGRTASTTLLTLLNAIPNVRLAGENGGQMTEITKMYDKVANRLNAQNENMYCSDPDNDDYDCRPHQRGAISPQNILCDLREYIRDIAQPVLPLLPSPNFNVRGFKEITWSMRSLAMLRSIFPCSRLVYSIRSQDYADLVTVYQQEFHMSLKRAQEYSTSQLKLLRTVKEEHEENLASGNGWKTFWMPKQDISKATVNDMLSWLGVKGCHFRDVVHSNENSTGQHAASDARNNLVGDCQWPF